MTRIVVLLILGILLVSPAVAGKLYKWKDENGRIHYGDSIPEKYRDNARQELNEQGIQVKYHKSAEQRKKDAEKAKLDLVRKKAEAEKLRKDRFLLTYQSVEQIERNHQKRINAIDGDIRFIQLKIKGYLKKVADVHKRAANMEIEGQIPKGLQNQIDTYKDKIAVAKNEIGKKEKQKEEIIAERNADVTRYKELKGLSEETEEDVAESQVSPN